MGEESSLLSTAGESSGKQIETLAQAVRSGDFRAIGRAISLVENRGLHYQDFIQSVYAPVRNARVVGVTGPPGAGKSTLVARLTSRLREADAKVGILAIDPTSPFSGGALLGDRVRMQRLYTDPGVFIRSMATRGAMGGLAPATQDAADILNAAGFDWIIVETVGVGQDEVDVVRSVDTVILVTLPGLGDDIQAIKAGIMEIADIFVINKADRDGVDRTVRDLQMMLGMTEWTGWTPPILRTVAIRGEGLEDLLEQADNHRRWLESGDELAKRRHDQLRLRVENILKEKVLNTARRDVGLDEELENALRAGPDPYHTAEKLFSGVVAVSLEKTQPSETEADRDRSH
jgi:LAO/AO transport system kinase